MILQGSFFKLCGMSARCSGWRQTFSVKMGDAEGGSDDEVFKIVGPCFISRAVCCICMDVTFNVSTLSFPKGYYHAPRTECMNILKQSRPFKLSKK